MTLRPLYLEFLKFHGSRTLTFLMRDHYYKRNGTDVQMTDIQIYQSLKNIKNAYLLS